MSFIATIPLWARVTLGVGFYFGMMIVVGLLMVKLNITDMDDLEYIGWVLLVWPVLVIGLMVCGIFAIPLRIIRSIIESKERRSK